MKADDAYITEYAVVEDVRRRIWQRRATYDPDELCSGHLHRSSARQDRYRLRPAHGTCSLSYRLPLPCFAHLYYC